MSAKKVLDNKRCDKVPRICEVCEDVQTYYYNEEDETFVVVALVFSVAKKNGAKSLVLNQIGQENEVDALV